MKYLCLIYEDETLWQKMPKTEADTLYAEYSAFKDGITKSGHLVGCNPLQPTHTATTVRVRNGKVSTTDGQGPQRCHPGGLEDPGGAPRKRRGAADHGVQPAIAEGPPHEIHVADLP